MQQALLEAVETYSAVQRWQLAPFQSPGVVLAAVRRVRAAALLAGTCSPPVRVLVGIRGRHADIAEPALLPRQADDGRQWGPVPRGDVFVQATSADRFALVQALRGIGDAMGAALTLLDEVHGGQLGEGLEPFGYRDVIVTPTADEIRAAATLPGPGPAEGGTWVLYLRCVQHVDRFNALTPAAQDLTIGRTRDGTLLDDLPEDSHVARMRAASPVPLPYVRRGFPYRMLGQEGLAFVAAGASLELMARALDAMVGFDGSVDRLNAFVMLQDSGLFWAPPREWAGWEGGE